MPGASMSPPQGSRLQLGYLGFGARSVVPSVLPSIAIIHVLPRVLLLLLVPTVALAPPAHASRNAWKPAWPAGIWLVAEFQPPTMPTELIRRLIASVSVSLFLSKSPIFHSPNAMVPLVPSVMSRIPRIPRPVLGVSVAKMPGGLAEVQGQTVAPTEPK